MLTRQWAFWAFGAFCSHEALDIDKNLGHLTFLGFFCTFEPRQRHTGLKPTLLSKMGFHLLTEVKYMF